MSKKQDFLYANEEQAKEKRMVSMSTGAAVAAATGIAVVSGLAGWGVSTMMMKNRKSEATSMPLPE